MAVIRLCLDTSAFSRLMRGQPNLHEQLEAADEILLPQLADRTTSMLRQITRTPSVSACGFSWDGLVWGLS